jgi:DNA-binding MarR family transcriptional regulator
MKAEETIDFHIKSGWYAISRMYNTYAAQFDMTMAIGYVLLHMYKDSTPATKIAPALGLESRSLTRMLTTLEDKKWIERSTNYEDKRVVKIFLTEIGKKKRDQARKGVIAFNKLIYDRVSPEKMSVFFDVMGTVNQVLEEDAGEILKTI